MTEKTKEIATALADLDRVGLMPLSFDAIIDRYAGPEVDPPRARRVLVIELDRRVLH